MTNSPAPKAALNPGKLAVAGILLLAVGLAGFSWWWNWQRTVRCREFYGGEGANLIRMATQVQGVSLSTGGGGIGETRAQEELLVGTKVLFVRDRVNLSEANGLIHARTALLDDNSYEWETAMTGDCQPTIPYAVRFREGPKVVTLAFDFRCRRVWVVETQRQIALAPKIASGWESFLKRQMSSWPAKSP